MDQRPQKKWDARAYLREVGKAGGLGAHLASPESQSPNFSPTALTPTVPTPPISLAPQPPLGTGTGTVYRFRGPLSSAPCSTPPSHLSSPINFYQQIFFQFPLLLWGDDLAFLCLCQIMANKVELRSTDQSQEVGSTEHFLVNPLSHHSIEASPSCSQAKFYSPASSRIPAVPAWGSL